MSHFFKSCLYNHLTYCCVPKLLPFIVLWLCHAEPWQEYAEKSSQLWPGESELRSQETVNLEKSEVILEGKKLGDLQPNSYSPH